MALYPAAGQPNVGPNFAYPPTITVIAGQPLPLTAKLFSISNQWLSGYERAGAPISWKIQELTGATGSGALDKDSGFQVTFTGYKGYQSVRVIATLNDSGRYASDSIAISIRGHDSPNKLVIEPDTLGRYADLTGEHRAGQVALGVVETTRSVYAVIRDPYGNFVAFSNPTVWTSRDTAIVRVTGGNASLGEGILMRPTPGAVGQAYVVAQCNSDPTLKDSVLVVLDNCCSGVSLGRSPQRALELALEIPGAGRRVFALPRDIGNARLSLALYSLSGRVVFKTEVVNAGKPICVNSSLQPGMYIVNVKTAERQLVKSRCVFVK
jgi:hypothetical protein